MAVAFGNEENSCNFDIRLNYLSWKANDSQSFEESEAYKILMNRNSVVMITAGVFQCCPCHFDVQILFKIGKHSGLEERNGLHDQKVMGSNPR